MSNLLIPSFLVSDVSELLRSLTKNDDVTREWIAQVAHQKWANHSFLEQLANSLICSFFRKKRAIRSETVERIPSPAK